MGNNQYGQLGDGTTATRTTPVQVRDSFGDPVTNVIAVAAGSQHSLFVTGDGKLWAMGDNSAGQLGNNTITYSRSPVQVMASTGTPATYATGVIAVAARGIQSLYVTSDGTLYSALGNYRPAPVVVATDVIAVAAGLGTAGSNPSLYVTSDGKLWGISGNNIATSTNVIAVAVGGDDIGLHSLYVTGDGKLWGWGDSQFGQLGTSPGTGPSSPGLFRDSSGLPLTNVISVTAGAEHTLYVTSDGKLWGCGRNDSGQLGDGTKVSARSTPVLIASGLVPVAPAFTTQPASQTVTAGQNATLAAAASGNPTPAYQWQSAPNVSGAWTDIPGATSDTLTLTAVTADMNGTQYRCVASNSISPDATSNAVTLTVNTTPAITTQPGNQTVIASQNAVFTIETTGSPAPTYQWQSSPNGVTWTNISSATTATLTLNNVTPAMSGNQYRCVATNAAGVANSNAATLTVNSVPAFTTQPQNVTITAGQTATFSITATGSPLPTYQWQSSPDGITWTNISGVASATSATLTLTSVTTAMSGTQYRCVVTNSVTSTTSNPVTLTVNAAPPANTAPTIITQPVSQTVTAGQTLTFIAEASGNPTPTYQWQKDGTNISGATSASYTITNAQLAASGTYRVVAANSQGTATSNEVSLTVNAIITVTFDAQSGSVSPATQTATQNSPYGTLPAPTRTSYTFGGWWTAANGAGTQIIATTIVTTTANQTLYAKWTATPATVTTVTPATAKAGDTITITGTNLTNAVVTSGGQPATVVSISSDGTTLTVLVPANTTSSAIVVTTAAGSITAPPTITITPPAAPQLSVDKYTLALAQPANSTATFAITSNAAWITTLDPATASAWLSVNPNAGTGNSPNTTTTASANNTGASRTASILVTSGTLTRTLIATQATNATGYAPATLPIGATFTLTTNGTPPATRAYTVAANNQLTTTDATGTLTLAYEYNATGSTGTLVIPDLDSVYLLQFTNATTGTLTLYTFDDAGTYELTGTFTYATPTALTYALTVNNGTGSGSYAAGATVTIAASAAASGKVFDKWTTTTAGVTFANATAATTTFTMPATAATVTATYKDQPTGGGNTGGGGNSGSGGGGGGGAPSLFWLAAAAALLGARASCPRKKA